MVKVIAGVLLATTLAVFSASERAWGDVYLLHGGGRVEGELLNPDELPRQTYAIRTTQGARITLTLSQVKQVLRPRPEQIEYEALRHGYPDTVEGQWELAEWCRQRSMLSQRNEHLGRLLELEPDHERARRALGYSRVGQKWMTQEDRMLAEGYVRFKGRWRLPQEVELMEKQRQKDDAEGEWKRRLGLWRGWLGGDKHRMARESIVRIDDPDAIKALAYALKEDSRDQARLLYIEALARIDTIGSNRILAIGAMGDEIEEVRLSCLDYLREKKSQEAVEYFISKLRHNENAMINRAATSLKRMEDPSAVGPLIEALNTIHKRTITSGKAGQTSSTFSNAGPGGLSMGSSTKVITRQISNRAVLDALVALTDGINYGFDEGRWKAWYTSQMTRPDLDARRN